MAKTLVVAEKPSVGRDLAAALPGDFKQSKDKTHRQIVVERDFRIVGKVTHVLKKGSYLLRVLFDAGEDE